MWTISEIFCIFLCGLGKTKSFLKVILFSQYRSQSLTRKSHLHQIHIREKKCADLFFWTQVGKKRRLLRLCHLRLTFKGTKLEIFVAGSFTQIRPVWVYDWGLIFTFLSTKFFYYHRRQRCKKYFLASSKKKVLSDCFYIHFNRPRNIFRIFNLLCLKLFLLNFKNDFFKRCRRQRLKLLSAVCDSVYIFSNVGDSAIKYQLVTFKPTHQNVLNLWPKSSTHTVPKIQFIRFYL